MLTNTFRNKLDAETFPENLRLLQKSAHYFRVVFSLHTIFLIRETQMRVRKVANFYIYFIQKRDGFPGLNFNKFNCRCESNICLLVSVLCSVRIRKLYPLADAWFTVWVECVCGERRDSV